MSADTTNDQDYRTPTTVSLGEQFTGTFERHYISEDHTDGRFWLELDDKGEWSPCDEDSDPVQVVVVFFSIPLELFFEDENKNNIAWSYDLQDFDVKYRPTDEQMKQATTPIELDTNGYAIYPVTDEARAKIKATVECSIDANLLDAEENFIEKMGGKM